MILRQFNWLGQLRVDVPHMRLLESSVVADFDILAGRMICGEWPYVLKGFTVSPAGVGQTADKLQLSVAGGLIMHFTASENGTIFWVPSDTAAEVLDPTNPRVVGSFTANDVNFVGLDLTRSTDETSSDLVKLLDADSELEISKILPLGRVLDYRIVITTEGFSVATNVLPICKVETDANNVVTTLWDARPMLYSLAEGGDQPDANHYFDWPSRVIFDPDTTSTSVNPFSKGDRTIESQKDWMDAVMTRLWELGGGEAWYAPSTDREIKIGYASPTLETTYIKYNTQTANFTVGNTLTGANSGATALILAIADNGDTGALVLGSVVGGPFQLNDPLTDPPGAGSALASAPEITTDQNFHFYDSGSSVYKLIWAGLTVIFANSTATYNTIANSSATGETLLDGYCVYVDVDRTSNATITPAIKPLISLGQSIIPGNRFVIAWRKGTTCYTRDSCFEVNRAWPYATTGQFGDVRIYNNDNEVWNSATPEGLASLNFDAAYGVPKLNAAGTHLLGTTVIGTDGRWQVRGDPTGTGVSASLAVLPQGAVNGESLFSVVDNGTVWLNFLKNTAQQVGVLTFLDSKISMTGNIPSTNAAQIPLHINPGLSTVGAPFFRISENGNALFSFITGSAVGEGHFTITAQPWTTTASDALIYMAPGAAADNSYFFAIREPETPTTILGFTKKAAGLGKLSIVGQSVFGGDPTSVSALDAILLINPQTIGSGEHTFAIAENGTAKVTATTASGANLGVFDSVYMLQASAVPLAGQGQASLQVKPTGAIPVGEPYFEIKSSGGTTLFKVERDTGAAQTINTIGDGPIVWDAARTKRIFWNPGVKLFTYPASASGDVLYDGGLGYYYVDISDSTYKYSVQLPPVPTGAIPTKVFVLGALKNNDQAVGNHPKVKLSLRTKLQGQLQADGAQATFEKATTGVAPLNDCTVSGQVRYLNEETENARPDLISFVIDSSDEMDIPRWSAGGSTCEYEIYIENVISAQTIAQDDYFLLISVGIEYTYNNVDNC